LHWSHFCGEPVSIPDQVRDRLFAGKCSNVPVSGQENPEEIP